MFRRIGPSFFLTILGLLIFNADAWSASKPNIVLITIDSLRVDSTGAFGKTAQITPKLDHFAQDGLVFSNAYAQSPETLTSTATILTGTYPQTHGASLFGAALPTALPYLPDVLHAAGYRTAAFVGSILLDPRHGPFQSYDRGFDRYEADFHLPQRGQSRFQSVEKPPDQVAAAAVKWLAENKAAPLFLWVDFHFKPSLSKAAYQQSASAADAALGNLLDTLRAKALYDDALIVVASTHGESLGAHGEETHSVFLYDETTHVPLLLKLPKKSMSGQRLARARLLDIAPTVLEIAGVSIPSQMQGQSLMRAAKANAPVDQPVYARSDLAQLGFGCSLLESWRAAKYLYIRAPQPELYDLPADPVAAHNLASNFKGTLDTLASQLQTLDARLGKQTASLGAGLSSGEVEKLASLGYVGLQKSTAGINAASEGTDPKERIAAINKTMRAYADLEDGKPELALPILREVLASTPNAYLVQYAMGEALVQQHHEADAIPYLHKAVELQPSSAWAHLEMGLALVETRDLKSAAVHLEIAASHLPRFAMVHAKLADVYEGLGRKQDAAQQRSLASER